MIARIDATKELRTPECMEPLQFSWQERHALPGAVILIAPDRKRIRRGEGPAQHRSVIELIVQSLQYRAGDCVTFEDFPKTRRSPPVHLVVAVMMDHTPYLAACKIPPLRILKPSLTRTSR